MKVKLEGKHSPCMMCYFKGISYDADSDQCKSCEYNIAIKLLKTVLNVEHDCTFCKNKFVCTNKLIDECNNGSNFLIDWELVCDKYGIEFDK